MFAEKNESHQKTQTSPKNHSWQHQLIAVLIGVFAFLSICAAGLICYGVYTKDKIALGVKVAGISISKLNYSEATDKISSNKTADLQQKITVKVNDAEYSTTPTALGTSYNIKEAVDQAYEVGKQHSLWQRMVSLTEGLVTNYNIPLPITNDNIKIDLFIQQIATKTNKDPVNAALTVKNNAIVEMPASNGIGVDTQKIKNKILAELNQLNGDTVITGDIQTLEAPIQIEQLTQAKEQAQTLTNHNITLTFENQTYSIDQKILTSWLDFPVNNNVVSAQITDAKMKAYVDSLAKKIDIRAVDRKISDVDQSILEEGSDGRSLNRTTLIAQIKEQLNNKDNTTTPASIAMQVDPVTRGEKIVRRPFTPGMYPGKYIEVNIDEQRMYLWEGMTKINEYTVSTGNIWSHPTPLGVRYIENKINNAWSSTYKLYMPWWMSIGGGYGIHELPYWPNGAREGERNLGHAVSHGCIRLGIGPAQEVYNWAEVGIPVYIHKNS